MTDVKTTPIPPQEPHPPVDTCREVVSVGQLHLLARCIGVATNTISPSEMFTHAELEELFLLKGCCEDAAAEADPEIIYGFNA